LPQACAWSDGDLYVVARRARLEDDVALRAPVVHDDLAVLLEGADEVAIEAVEAAILTLRRLATGKLAVEKEMRELDGKLGLSPEALAKLRWSIVDEGVDDAPAAPARPGGTVRNLRAVDPKLADEHQAS
jgi:hypothetical protein